MAFSNTSIEPRRFLSLAILGIILSVGQGVRGDVVNADAETMLSALKASRGELSFRVLYKSEWFQDASIAPILPKLSDIASDQAMVWADTILEGEFEASGETHLEQVEGVFLAENLIGYRIVYSERAWWASDIRSKRHLGRIVEASFVSESLNSWFRDIESYAQFHDEAARVL